MTTTTTWRGAILAGGESRRMGTDKALLEYEGLPLWERQRQVLQDSGIGDLIVVRRPGQPLLDPAIPHVRDLVPGAGPIAGLQAALAAGPVSWLAVLAVDMPAIDAGWFEWVRRACRDDQGAVARHADGFEPLAAVYPGSALEIIGERMQRGEFSLQGLVQALVASGRLAVLNLPESERHRVANWNSPADRAP
jgi:molybdopterin-guanine dinucleotide biosynthesis protein A